MYYGWRGKIGHVCPALYDTGAYEFEKILPAGVITVTVTLTRRLRHLLQAAGDDRVGVTILNP